MIAWLALAAAAAPRGVRVEPAVPEGFHEAWAPKKVALVVGIDDYDDDAVPDLAFAAQDAADIGRVLDERAGFDRVDLLTGHVTRASFWAAFDAATATLERQDTFVLYFAGHGTLDWEQPEQTALFLLASDAALDRAAATAIPLSSVDARVSALRTQRRVVVLDSCYSGLGRSAYSPEVANTVRGLRGRAPISSRPELTSRYEARLYAADYYEPASEDPELGNGVYTHFLVAGLEGGAADLDGDGRVELLEAHWWAQQRTMAHTGRRQNPWMEITQVGAEWLYLTDGAAAAPSAGILYVPHDVGPTRGLAAPLRVEVDGEPRTSGAITPGVHDLSISRAGRTVRALALDVRPGDRIDTTLLARTRRRHRQPVTLDQALVPTHPATTLSLSAGQLLPAALAGPAAGLSLSAAPQGHGLRPTASLDLAAALTARRWAPEDAPWDVARIRTWRTSVALGARTGERLSFAPSWTAGTWLRAIRTEQGSGRGQAAPFTGAALQFCWQPAPLSVGATLELAAFPLDGHLAVAPLARIDTGLRF